MVTGHLHIPQASFPSVNLGVPLFVGSSRHFHFNRMLDSLRSRPKGWRTKCLSFAGRLILVNHVLSSIPLHISLAFPVPSKTYNLIEMLIKSFFMLSTLGGKDEFMVRWETVCLPKLEGGLGLHRIKELNEACMLTLGWLASTSISLG